MLKLIQNATVYAPEFLGKKDILIAGEKIVAIEDTIDVSTLFSEVIDFKGKILTPGLIDQHVHSTAQEVNMALVL
jgi:beta-aspartyl-dipeptidase (metallo-type)